MKKRKKERKKYLITFVPKVTLKVKHFSYVWHFLFTCNYQILTTRPTLRAIYRSFILYMQVRLKSATCHDLIVPCKHWSMVPHIMGQQNLWNIPRHLAQMTICHFLFGYSYFGANMGFLITKKLVFSMGETLGLISWIYATMQLNIQFDFQGFVLLIY